jgi:hypothetical protein
MLISKYFGTMLSRSQNSVCLYGPGKAHVALSRVTRLQGMYVIKIDPVAELPLVDVDASIFTADNHALTARGPRDESTSRPPPPPDSTSPHLAPTGHARRARPRRRDPRETKAPPPRRARRVS